MKCDRCGEQLPVVDGIDYCDQTLCLECAMRGCNPYLVQSYEISLEANLHDKKLLRESPNTNGSEK